MSLSCGELRRRHNASLPSNNRKLVRRRAALSWRFPSNWSLRYLYSCCRSPRLTVTIVLCQASHQRGSLRTEYKRDRYGIDLTLSATCQSYLDSRQICRPTHWDGLRAPTTSLHCSRGRTTSKRQEDRSPVHSAARMKRSRRSRRGACALHICIRMFSTYAPRSPCARQRSLRTW